MMRKAALVLTAFLLLYWLPADIESVRYGLEHQPKLALGISLKLFMHVMAIAGLALDSTFGYAFLLGASAQGLLVSTSALRAIPMADWWLHKGQLIVPALDVLIRLFCLGFLASCPKRIVGMEEEG